MFIKCGLQTCEVVGVQRSFLACLELRAGVLHVDEPHDLLESEEERSNDDGRRQRPPWLARGHAHAGQYRSEQ
jgi:hypothetical protein